MKEISWLEFNKKGETVSKRKALKDEKALEKFADKLEQKIIFI